jgi:hypothetical protein
VQAMIQHGNTIYIGGSFTSVYANTGSGAVLDFPDWRPIAPYPRIDGVVHAAVPDGAGGWYIGGTFTTVGSVPRSRLAHVRADGTVSPWNPNAGSTVFCLAVSGNTVYVGGQFIAIGGQARNRIAAIDGTTGLATAWNPNANNIVLTLLLDGSTLYAGGLF